MDNMSDHLVTTTAGIHSHEQQQHQSPFDVDDDDEPELANKIDFAEKLISMNEFSKLTISTKYV